MAKRAYIFYISNENNRTNFFLVKQKALALRLKGKCLTLQNGQIEIDIEGKAKAVDEFIKFIEKGTNLQVNAQSFTIEISEELKGYTTMETNLV